MFTCPGCGEMGGRDRDICACGADLTALRQIDTVADAWFNEGLRAAAAGDDGLALEWLSAACAARPDDVEARLEQARAWGRLGRTGEARRAVARAAAIDPEAPPVRQLNQHLNAAPPRRRGGRNR